MPTTPTLLLPYPAPTDPADVPTDMGELATRIETVRGLADGLASLDAAAKVPLAQLLAGVANGLATLGADGKVPAAQLPASTPGGGGEISYTQITANVSVTATAEASAATVVTAPAYAADGATAVIVQFVSQSLIAPASASIVLWLFQDGASLGRIAYIPPGPAGVSIGVPVHCVRRLTPASGSRTYSVRATVSSGTGTVAAGAGGAGADSPAFIRLSRA